MATASFIVDHGVLKTTDDGWKMLQAFIPPAPSKSAFLTWGATRVEVLSQEAFDALAAEIEAEKQKEDCP